MEKDIYAFNKEEDREILEKIAVDISKMIRFRDLDKEDKKAIIIDKFKMYKLNQIIENRKKREAELSTKSELKPFQSRRRTI